MAFAQNSGCDRVSFADKRARRSRFICRQEGKAIAFHLPIRGQIAICPYIGIDRMAIASTKNQPNPHSLPHPVGANGIRPNSGIDDTAIAFHWRTRGRIAIRPYMGIDRMAIASTKINQIPIHYHTP
jgi:hypothetical protein